jgi:hypothetical protein
MIALKTIFMFLSGVIDSNFYTVIGTDMGFLMKCWGYISSFELLPLHTRSDVALQQWEHKGVDDGNLIILPLIIHER